MVTSMQQTIIPAVQRLLVIPVTMADDKTPSKELKELNDHLADDWKFVSMAAPGCGDKLYVCIEKRSQRIGSPIFI
jgi:hypothetical protein